MVSAPSARAMTSSPAARDGKLAQHPASAEAPFAVLEADLTRIEPQQPVQRPAPGSRREDRPGGAELDAAGELVEPSDIEELRRGQAVPRRRLTGEADGARQQGRNDDLGRLDMPIDPWDPRKSDRELAADRRTLDPGDAILDLEVAG